MVRKQAKTAYQFPVGEKTLAEYQRQVKNTRAKLRRLQKQHGVDLSDEIKIPKLEDFGRRKEFNAWVREAEQFRNRSNMTYQFVKNQYGVSASKRQLKEIERNVKKAQQLADQQIAESQDLPFISGGQTQSTVGMQRPNKTGIYRPHDFDFEEVRSTTRLEEIQSSADKKSEPEYYDRRAEQMKENFIKALGGSFNSLADELVDAIKNIPASDFYQIYLMFDEFDFDYFDTEGQFVSADETTIGQMLKYVRRYEEKGLSRDLWHQNFN